MENWAAQERLRAVERALWWRVWIGRPDLVAVFGISAAQASSDLQKYLELNPGAMVYQMSRKRYEATEGMACVLHAPRLEEGMSFRSSLLGMPGSSGGGGLRTRGKFFPPLPVHPENHARGHRKSSGFFADGGRRFYACPRQGRCQG